MPNKRNPNKTYIGGYILKTLHAEICRLAREEGMEHNRFGFVEKLIREALERRRAVSPALAAAPVTELQSH